MADAAAAEKKIASGKVVKYIGTAQAREITRAQWKNIGVENQATVVWDASNKHTVSADDLTDKALDYINEEDDGLVIADAPVKE